MNFQFFRERYSDKRASMQATMKMTILYVVTVVAAAVVVVAVVVFAVVVVVVPYLKFT